MRQWLFSAAIIGLTTGLTLAQSTPTTRPTTVPAAQATSGARDVVSAKTALNRKLPSVTLKDVALNDAIEFFRDASGANVTVDWAALEEIGVSKETPVSLSLKFAPVRISLKATLESAAPGLLSWSVEQNVITITTQARADAKMITRVYPVQDLIAEIPDFEGPNLSLTDNSASRNNGNRNGNNNRGGNNRGLFDTDNENNGRNKENTKTRIERGQDLIDVITETVRPEIWDINGGKAKIKFFNGTLIITAPRSVHEAIGGPID
jgi:hypothetical protein